LFPIVSFSQILSGTSIVIAWSDSTIVIGADSKLTSSDDSTFSAWTCKIIVINDSIIFVHSGIFTDPIGLNMQSEIRFFLSSGGTLDERLTIFKDTVVHKLDKIFAHKKKDRPDDFEKFRPLEAASCIVVVIGADSLRMRFISFSGMVIPDIPEGFWISGSISDPIRTGRSLQKTPFLMPLGHYAMTFAFSDSSRTHSIILSPRDFPRIVYSLITLESVLNPRDVGGPIDVIRLTLGKRPEWINQEKEPCK
jgi:hypothetical protein